MTRFRFVSRLLASVCVVGMACAQPVAAQAERPEVPVDTTAQDSTMRDSTAQRISLFDTQLAGGHMRRRPAVSPEAASRSPLAPETVAPAVSTATAVPPGHVVLQPLPEQPSRPGSTYEATALTLDVVRTEEPLAESAAPVSESTDARAATAEQLPEPSAPEASPDVTDLLTVTTEGVDTTTESSAPEVIAAEDEPVAVAAALEDAPISAPMLEPTPPEVDTTLALQLFDTRIASGHKELADVPPPTFFDTRLANGHKELVEREGTLFDTNVAAGYKELPAPEPLEAYEDAVGIRAAGQFVISPEGMEYVLAEAVRVGRLFNGSGKRRRAYFPMIERALDRRNLPLELKYLALIESSMDPLAVSSAGARGLWQIMPGTAGDFGTDSLAVHDPQIATNVAVRYLERLHRMFDGDWLLALAAYNSGPGRVQGLVRQFERANGRDATYWDIRAKLPRETRDYVPRFLAAIFYAQSGV